MPSPKTYSDRSTGTSTSGPKASLRTDRTGEPSRRLDLAGAEGRRQSWPRSVCSVPFRKQDCFGSIRRLERLPQDDRARLHPARVFRVRDEIVKRTQRIDIADLLQVVG